MSLDKEPREQTLPATSPAPAPAAPSTTVSYRRALVPLDGSPLAEAVIPPFVIKIARPLDLEIVLMQVVEPLPPPAVDTVPVIALDDTVPIIALDTTDQEHAEADRYLTAVAGDLIRQGVRVQTLVRVGAPAEQIVEAARESGADLIAMTTHGRSGLGRLFFGSVAEAVLHRSPVPMFLMRVTEIELSPPR